MHMYLGIGTCHELWLIVHIFLYMCLPLQTLDVLMHKQDFLYPSLFSLSSFLCPHQITLLLCYAMLCLSPLLPPLSSPPSFLYPPCSVCPAHSLLPLPLPYNQKSFSQMCMLAFPSIIHDQSFGPARDNGLATWEILQRVTAPAQNHRW